MKSKCIYCGSDLFGKSCPHSPNGFHEHSTSENNCVYCGSSSYGACPFSPFKKHCHGHSKVGEIGKCRWCGTNLYGSCSMSPSRKHEH